MSEFDTQKLGLELRQALEALGITSDRITVREEPIPGQLWIRCSVQIGDQSIDVHSPVEMWPPAANTARTIRWVLAHGKKAELCGTVDDWVAGFKRLSTPKVRVKKTTRRVVASNG